MQYCLVVTIVIITTKGQKVLHSCAQLLLPKTQQLPLKYSDFHFVAIAASFIHADEAYGKNAVIVTCSLLS